jgi:prepilin-type N-terminal cleavage/methylation domain-containing protein
MRLINRNLANAMPPGPLPAFQVRSGFSLTEVLIAIFVLAIGMMGILALFPLGAAQMAQAIKDERTGQLADIGEAHMRILWRQAWLVPYSSANPTNPNVGALDTEQNMVKRFPEFAFDFGQTSATSTGPGQPIYLDPLGAYAGQPASIANQGMVMRYNSSATSALAQRIRVFGLIDDLSFIQNGQAAYPISRADRYNAAFLLQRQKNNVRQEVNLKVVVYQGRAPDQPSIEVPIGTTTVAPNTDSIHVSTSGIPLRLNSWVLLSGTSPEPFADFYRVVGYTESQISVSPQVRVHGSINYYAYAAILTDVIEVFDRGTITPFEVAAP